MILAKDLDVFNSKYDFTDSIVTDINWDSNLLDLLVTLDYYWDIPEENNKLTIRFKNCRETIFALPKAYESTPKSELQSYVYSWYTITNWMAVEESGLLRVNIKTVDDDPRWLTVLCDEIWLEQKQ